MCIVLSDYVRYLNHIRYTVLSNYACDVRVAYLRGVFSDLCCSCCMQLVSSISSRSAVFLLMPTLMTFRFINTSVRLNPPSCWNRWRTASPESKSGWSAIDCALIPLNGSHLARIFSSSDAMPCRPSAPAWRVHPTSFLCP